MCAPRKAPNKMEISFSSVVTRKVSNPSQADPKYWLLSSNRRGYHIADGMKRKKSMVLKSREKALGLEGPF